MRMLFAVLASLLALALFGGPAPRADADAQSVRAEAVSLARRQAGMWDAAVRNDWESLYGQVFPQTRQEVSLLQFMANPHYPPSLAGVKICGADTAAPVDENARAKELIDSGSAPSYKPPILGYRFAEMRFSPDFKRALVISNLSVAAVQFLGPTSTVMPMYEFWIKDADGAWYADVASTMLVHMSGAATGKDPMEELTVKIEPARLAAALVEEANAAEKDRAALLEQALWLDVPEAVSGAERLGMGRREQMRGHLDRVYAGMWKSPGYFPVLMDAARWYRLIGENGVAYDCYRYAVGVNKDDAFARAGAALAAAMTGRWAEASAHYRHLLLLGAAIGGPLPPSLEAYLAPECRLCQNIPAAEGLAIAAGLCNRQDYATAVAIYRFYARRHSGFADGLARLKRGEEATLTRLLGKELAAEAAGLTYHDASGLLAAAGVRLTHSGDIPVGGVLPKGGVALRSSNVLSQTDFSTGLYEFAIPAEGYIRGGNAEFAQKLSSGGGWLLAFMEGERLQGAFHPDDAKGQNPSFEETMAKIKKGTTLFVARVGSAPLAPDGAKVKALESAGVDAARLPIPLRNFVMAGIKGGKRGSARVFASDAGIYKTLDAALDAGKGSVKISGFGPAARVRLAR